MFILDCVCKASLSIDNHVTVGFQHTIIKFGVGGVMASFLYPGTCNSGERLTKAIQHATCKT